MSPAKKLAAPAVALLAAGSLAAGCSSDDHPLGDETWQVVGLYTDPLTPGDLPRDAAGKATLRVDRKALQATTGCTSLEAEIEQRDDELTVTDAHVGDVGDCIGGSRYVHDELTSLFTPGATFAVQRIGDREAALTLTSGDAVERPSIRMMVP